MDFKKARFCDLMIATTSEDAEGVCKAVAWLGNKVIAISGDAFIYRHTLNPKYVAYIFQTSRFWSIRFSIVQEQKWFVCQQHF